MSDREGHSRRIISVIGPHSGCGKSTLICHILKHIPGLACLKISPRAEWMVPPAKGRRPQRRHCDIVKSAALHRVEPDTDRYLAAGAVQVWWLQYTRNKLAAEIQEALTHFAPGTPVITEGTVAVKYARPNAVILVMSSSPREMKPACQAVLSAVTDLVIDGTADETVPSINDRLSWMYPQLRPQRVWAVDLASADLPGAFFDRLRRLVGMSDLTHLGRRGE